MSAVRYGQLRAIDIIFDARSALVVTYRNRRPRGLTFLRLESNNWLGWGWDVCGEFLGAQDSCFSEKQETGKRGDKNRGKLKSKNRARVLDPKKAPRTDRRRGCKKTRGALHTWQKATVCPVTQRAMTRQAVTQYTISQYGRESGST